MSSHPNNNINIAGANINVLTTYVLRLFIVIVIVNIIKTQKKVRKRNQACCFWGHDVITPRVDEVVIVQRDCNAYLVWQLYKKKRLKP